MSKEDKPSTARNIMLTFAKQTGLSSEKVPDRYLWTDAFAVCNFLELYRQTGKERYRTLARQLVEQVHEILGRHREDDARSGWISGLPEAEGRAHPTAGGLRIGKPLPERGADEPHNRQLEWERDGQYYHYLTKWMHALHRMSQETGELRYHRWALELAATAHGAFTYTLPGGERRMYWKMSIDLSRPLVRSMGQHDPLDGLLTYHELASTATDNVLEEEIAEITALCQRQHWGTHDPLGLGGLLTAVYRTAHLIKDDEFEHPDMLTELIDAALFGLNRYLRRDPLAQPARYRLAFRELGLSVGLHAVERLQGHVEELPAALKSYAPLAEEIEAFWRSPANQQAPTWMDHLNINRVMLATSLAPTSYLQM